MTKVTPALLLALTLFSCDSGVRVVGKFKSEGHKVVAAFTPENSCMAECTAKCAEPTPTLIPTAVPTVTPEPVDPSFTSTSVRGLSCLYCTLPKADARASAETVVQTLIKANITRPGISFLVSGTFGAFNDEQSEFICNTAKRLQQGDRKAAVIELYWQSGPSQRRSSTGFFNGIGDKTAPSTWNTQIKGNAATRASVLAHLKKVAALAACIQNTGATVFVGALEDNYDDATFKSSVQPLVANASFPPGTHFSRNGGSFVPFEWHKERHGSFEASCRAGGDIWSNDGFSLDNDFTAARPYGDSCDAVHGLAFLHCQKCQGVAVGVPFQRVEDRTYRSYSASEQAQIISWLKEEKAPPASSGLAKVCPSIIPVQTPILWKESSQDTNDAREGKGAILIPIGLSSGSGVLTAYNNQGVSVAKLGAYKPPFVNTHDRYYICSAGGSCESPSQLKAKASPMYVGIGNGKCLGPISDPSKRQGATK